MPTAVCRACLGGAAGGLRLITIDDELELYERLTNTKLSTERICNTLCYICYSHLQRFRKFSDMACKAETYLKVLQINTEGSEITLTNLLKLAKIPASKLSVMTLKPIIMGGHKESKPIATKKVSEEKTHLVTDKVKIESTSKEVIKINKEPTFILKELVKKRTTKEIVKTELIDNEIVNSIKNNNLITEVEFIAELHKNKIDVTIDNLQESKLNNIESSSVNGLIFEDDMNVEEYVVVNASESLCYECDICNKTFTTHKELSAHLLTHKINENPTIEDALKGTPRNTCPICKKTFTFSASLIPHLKTHIGEKPYICDVCGRSCRKKHNLQEHMKIHTGEKVFCKICNKGFTQTSSLGKHMYIHNGLTPYCCHICGRSFKQNSHMYVHIRHAHEGYKSHRCDICNKMLSGKRSWRQHMDTHNPEKAYSCDKCLIKFATAYSLQRHKKKYCRKAGVNIKIDGSIDLGPKWSYELKPVLRTGDAESIKTKHRPIAPTPHMPEVVSYMMEKYVPKNEADDYMDHLLIEGIASTNKKIARNIAPYNLMNEVQKINKLQNEAHKSTLHKKVTKAVDAKDNTFVRSRKVKDDLQITEFTKHIYKQSLKVFDAIKEKTTDENIKKEVDLLAQNYEEKFGEFVRKTQNQNIKTRLGRQRVIINTLETSNLILKRLVNYLVGMDKDVLRSEITANVYKNEVNKKMEIEKSHICKKFGICRTHDGFTVFTIELIKIILLCNETQIKQLSDAFTEVMKYTDFSHVMDMSTEKHFVKGMSDIETYDVALLRAILSIVKNVLVNKNKPIEVVGDFDKRVNKTVGALEIVDALENALPPNEKNRLEWEDIKNSVTEWRDGKRTDIMEITQAYVDHLQRGMDSFNSETAKNFERNLNLILGFL